MNTLIPTIFRFNTYLSKYPRVSTAKFPQIFPDQNVQRHSVTSLETTRSLANDPSVGGLRGNSPGLAASPISLLSMGGVCGRSLTERKIIFTGRQTCSLYLVLWLCVAACRMHAVTCSVHTGIRQKIWFLMKHLPDEL